MDFMDLALTNQQRAREVIAQLGVTQAWESIGANVNLVGSLKSGLLMKHRDIDFHIYTDRLDIGESFRAMQEIARNRSVKRIAYGNLIDTEEECIEWHAWYEDNYGDTWQIDMIHILRGTRYDGVIEKVTDGIIRLLTPETRRVILQIKYQLPEDANVMGIEVYRAVFQGGVRNYDEFCRWKEQNPTTGVFDWIP